MSIRQSPPAAGHAWATELLSALLDGELDETTAAAVTDHVQACAECSRDWDELRATKQLLATLPAAQAPRSYAIRADDLGEPEHTWATFWQRLLGLTWRLSGAVAVVVILIGTMQIAGINLGREAETQYVQAEPQAGPARPPGELGATGAAGAPAASDVASQANMVAKEQAMVVEQVAEEQSAKLRLAEQAVAAARAPSTADARAPTPDAGPAAAAAPPPVGRQQSKPAAPPAAPATKTEIADTATAQPTAPPTRPTAVPPPERAAPAVALQREPAGPTFAPGVLWLIGGAVVGVVAGAAGLGERWVRGRRS